MKLGISHNVFDGEELLEYSIKCVRPLAHHISVVYQTISNKGEKNITLENYLKELKTRQLIDFLYKYEPDLTISARENETKKRDIGLKIAKANSMQYFMTMDTDELYDKKQLVDALANFCIGDYDSSFCQMKTFYKVPTAELVPPETYYVPLFYRINKHSQIKQISDKDYPVTCDPTRRMRAGYVRVFTRDEIEMYHYSYVRNDIRSKIYNSSSGSNENEKKEILNHFNKWKDYKDGALLIGNQRFKLKEVPNKFEIKL